MPSIIYSLIKGILNENTFNKLSNLGLLNEINLTENRNANYDAIVEDLGQKLSKKVLAVVDISEKKISKLSAEISELISILDSKQREYCSAESIIQKKFDELQTEINNCNLFSFSKKKELNQEITSLENYKSQLLSLKIQEMKSLILQKNELETSMESLF